MPGFVEGSQCAVCFRTLSFWLHWNLSLATKHWNLLLATKLGSLFTSFLLIFFKRVNSDHLGFSFLYIIFNFKSWEYLFPQPLLGGKKWLFLVDGRKKESRMNLCSSFERMEVSKDNWELEIFENFHKPSQIW
jgi:hypothetical protein